MASIPFAVRSSSGIGILRGPPKFGDVEEFVPVKSKSCQTMLFSPDGTYFSYIDGQTLKILKTDNWKDVATIQGIKIYHMAFSPKSTFLMTWQPFTVTKANPEGSPNLHIYKSENGELVKSFVHKTENNWEPQWSSDEKLFSKMVNTDVVFYEDLNFDRIVAKINSYEVLSYKLSPNIKTYCVLCYTSRSPEQPSRGRLLKYPNFETQQSIANENFTQADKVYFYWNNTGDNALLLTSTLIDKTSAYGKQGLHFFGLNGPTMILLDKKGPIYSVQWSPTSQEFCVVYGFKPGKATIFNLRCEPIFELGPGVRNFVYYNPHGNILLLGGFGNLRGHIEMWDVVSKKKIGSCEAPDSTLLQWSADGEHFLTATTAPRFHIENGFKIWHYSGALLFEKLWPKQGKLYEVTWKTFPKLAFPDPIIENKKVEGILPSQPLASTQPYRPPPTRNRLNIIRLNLDDDDDDEPPRKYSKAKVPKRRKEKLKKPITGNRGEEEPKEAVDNSIKIKLAGDSSAFEMKGIKKIISTLGSTSPTDSISLPPISNSSSSGKQDKCKEILDISEEISTQKNIEPKRTFTLIGKAWGAKLRALPQEQRIQAERLVNDIFYEASLGTLNRHCKLNIVPDTPTNSNICVPIIRPVLQELPPGKNHTLEYLQNSQPTIESKLSCSSNFSSGDFRCTND